MKIVMIVYNEVMDLEVMEALAHCGMKNFTKITGVYGKGNTSGVHLGTDVWPGRNNILYVACDDNHVKRLIHCVAELRKQLGHEGVKAFVWNLENLDISQSN